MSKKTWIIISVIIVLAIIIYFAYVKLIKNGSLDKTSEVIGSIDCSKYWSLNSIDKQYCKNKGLAPVSPNVQTSYTNTSGNLGNVIDRY